MADDGDGGGSGASLSHVLTGDRFIVAMKIKESFLLPPAYAWPGAGESLAWSSPASSYRQTDRQTDRQAGRQADTHTHTHTFVFPHSDIITHTVTHWLVPVFWT